MKSKILSLSLTLFLSLLSWNVMADTGWFSDYVKLNVNGVGVSAPTGYYWIGTDPSYGTSLVTGLGNVTSLILDGADMKYWSDTQDRTGGSFFYEVKSADGAITYKAATEVVWTQTALGGNDYQGISSGLNVNLLTGIPSGTACKLTVWAKSWGSNQGDSWLSNGGANYVATFTKVDPVSVSGSASQDGYYPTLSTAISAIGTSQTNRNIEVKIGASITETSAITIGNGDWSSLKIYPTANNLTCSNVYILLSGAKNVIIDGRVNATGNPAVGASTSLTLSSTSTTDPVISFDSDAQNNTVKYCIIKIGAIPNTANKGGIYFGANASTNNGNGNNLIDRNLITSNGSTLPSNAIYATGSTTYPNKGNQITNNEFTNFMSSGAPAIGILILGSATSNINDNYTISGNSMYGNLSTDTGAGGNRFFIQIGTAGNGGSHTITDNYIGGSSAQCGGSRMTKSGTVASHFNGIALTTSGAGNSLVQNNRIQNISWTTASGNQQNFTGISVAGSGTATISGNIIGNNITSAYANTASIISSITGTNASTLTAISISTTGTVTCENNQIGSIRALNTGAAGTAAMTINGISKSGGGTTTISNNIIGSLTVPYSINDSITNTTLYAQNTNGINFSGTGTVTINNNTIANLANRTNTGAIYAIYLNGSGSGTINGNLIHSNIITGATTAINYGIWCNAAANSTITNNIVRLGNNNTYELRGIGDANVAGTIKVIHNTVYLSGAPTSGALISAALYNAGALDNRDYRNNILVNARSNNGATGKHYALYSAATSYTTFALNANNYYVSGTGGTLGYYNGADKSVLPLVPTKDAASLVGNPSFTNAGGTTPQSYVPNSTALTGVNLSAAVPTDYNGSARSTTPTMGAIDYITWNGSTWSKTPSDDYHVRIGVNYVGAGFVCRNLIVDAGKQLSINSGTLAVGNNFTILSDATNGTGTYTNSGSLTVGGTTTVQQYLTAGRNWYMSSPITAGTASMLSRGDSVVQYNEVLKKWERVTGSLTPGRGYIQAAVATNGTTGTVDFSGVLNSGTIPVTVTRTESGSNRGFNLVGNPYPSFLNSATFLSANNTKIEGNIWYRTHTGTAYEFNTYNSVSDQSVPKASNGSYIPPMQGFWVRALSTLNTLPEEDRKIEFTNTMRKHNDTTVVIKLRAPKAPVERQFIRLQVSNANLNDELLIYSDANASNNYDAYDAPKMMNTSSNSAAINLFTKAGVENLVIDGRTFLPLDVVIPVTFTTNAFASGSFTISANELTNLPSGVTVKIIDNGIETSLSDGGTYTFTADAGATKTFGLVLRSPGAVTGIENGNANSFRVYANGNRQMVIMAPEKSNYAIYNTLGQLIQNGTLTSEHETLNTKLSSGVYVVKTENQSTRVIVK